VGDNVYLKSFIGIVVVGLLVLGAVVLNQYKQEIVISNLSLSQNKTKKKGNYSAYFMLILPST